MTLIEFNKNFNLKLADIKIGHQNIFKKYSNNSELWEHFFLYLLLNKVRWVELDEAICIFQKDFFDQSWQLQSLPLGKEQKTIKVLKQLVNNQVTSKILFVTEKDLDIIKNTDLKIKNSVKITEEFIYNTKDLIELSGNNYQKIREYINRFQKNYQYKLSSYGKGDYKEVNKFLEIWYKQKIKDKKETLISLKEDFKNTKNSFNYLNKINNIRSLIVKSNNKIIGISTFGFLNNKMAIGFNIKTSYKEYKGVTEFMVHEVAKNISDITFLNSGGYGKSESLKTHKEKFRPTKINSIYKVYFK